jgi:hypothetical protein
MGAASSQRSGEIQRTAGGEVLENGYRTAPKNKTNDLKFSIGNELV